MDIQSASDSTMAAAQMAVQVQMMAQMKAQGADTVALISSAAPKGSVNQPGQGLHVDFTA